MRKVSGLIGAVTISMVWIVAIQGQAPGLRKHLLVVGITRETEGWVREMNTTTASSALG